MVVWFWKWVNTLSLKDKKALLVFWTGASAVPVSAGTGSVRVVSSCWRTQGYLLKVLG